MSAKTIAKSKANAESTPAPEPRDPTTGLTRVQYFALSHNIPNGILEAYNDVLGQMLSDHLPAPFKEAFWAYTLSYEPSITLGSGDLAEIANAYSDMRAYLVRAGEISVPRDFRVFGLDDAKAGQ